MSKKQIFDGFSEEQEKQWTQQATETYGEDNVKPSVQRWNSYSAEKKAQIKEEGGAIYSDMVGVMDQGPDSPAVQASVARWHQHLRYFYEPSPARLRGLGQLYNTSPDFMATFEQFHPDLPAFLEQAITVYCDNLDQ